MSAVANNLWKAANPGATTNFCIRIMLFISLYFWGGLTTNFIWCMILNARNKTFGDYTDKKTPLLKKLFFCCTGRHHMVLAIFLLRMGESKLGNGASSWILHMAFIILVANMWGIALKEWKGVSRKTATTITIGILSLFFYRWYWLDMEMR